MSVKKYHEHTSYQRNKMPMHFLDWENQPLVFKAYPEGEYIQLPRNVRHYEGRLSTILKSPLPSEDRPDPDLNALSRIFSLANGITGRGGHSSSYHYYRSVASAGALYPVEVYASTHGVQGLDDGLYHFSIAQHALTPLRTGDFSVHVSNAIYPPIEISPKITFFLSAIFFRSAWKYRDRSYRYHLLDTGHLLENLIVALKAEGYSFAFSFDFDDHELNRFLGFDEKKEVCLAVCYLPNEHPFKEEDTGQITDLPETVKASSTVSARETEYPEVFEIHQQGMLKTAASREAIPVSHPAPLKSDPPIDIAWPETWPEELNCAEALSYRRSKRNYVPKSLSYNNLTALLECLSIKEKCAASNTVDYQNAVRTGLIVGNAEGLDPGFYLLYDSKGALGKVISGHFTDTMAHICLDQKWLSNAALHFVFLTDTEMLDKYCGARGYRYAMMIAGRMGERLYLAATAMGLGCCGIGAFYDSEAAQLLGLNKTSRLLYLVAVGPIKSR